jgi:hypothetical protein
MAAPTLGALPLWARVAIEWMDARPELRSEAKLDELLGHFAAVSATVVDETTRQSARAVCRRRFMASYTEPPVRQAVPPGGLRLVRLFHDDGMLHPGDRVATTNLGDCEVACIHSSHAIQVCEMTTGRHYLLCGTDFGPSVRAVDEASKSDGE